MKINNSPKTFNNYKCATPEETIRIITEGFNRLGLEIDWIAKQNLTQSKLFSGSCHLVNLPVSTNGKGCTYALSKASAFAEMAERFSSGIIFRQFKSLSERNDIALKVPVDLDSLNYCLHYQFLNGHSSVQPSGAVRKIMPEAFSPAFIYPENYYNNLLSSKAARFDWVDGYSLTRNEKVKIPIRFLSHVCGSNGLAAGNTIEEAISQATCEVFERYCILQIIKNRQSVPTISLDSITNKRILEIIDFYKHLNIKVKIKDFSLNGRFPVIGVFYINMNLEKDTNPLTRNFYYHQANAGSALNIEEAILRCLTEKMQGRTNREIMFFDSTVTIWQHWVEKMGNAFDGSLNYRKMLHKNDIYGDLDFLMDDSKSISINSLQFSSTTDYADDIDRLLTICKNEDLELIVIDKTHPVLLFPTVRVFIPQISWVKAPNRDGERVIDKLLANDDEFMDAAKLGKSIETLKVHLARDLIDNREKTLFGLTKSIFEILAISSLKMKKYDEALNYFNLVKELLGTKKYNQIIGSLENKEYNKIDPGASLKNPLVYGWDMNERAQFEFIIPNELNKLLRCFRN